MKLLKESKERNWYLVQEWTTRSGLKARIQYCVWNKKVRDIASSLHPFYTGYVQRNPKDLHIYYDDVDINVHGGVTFEGDLEDAQGLWVGFDMAHLGDENNQDLSYAVEECESLAKQMDQLSTPWYIRIFYSKYYE